MIMKIFPHLLWTLLLLSIFNKVKSQFEEVEDEDEYDDEYEGYVLSKMTHTESTNQVVNKSIILELFSKDDTLDTVLEDSEEEEIDDDDLDLEIEDEEEHKKIKAKIPLVGKLTVQISTTILKDGKQIGPSIVKNETIFLEEDETVPGIFEEKLTIDENDEIEIKNVTKSNSTLQETETSPTVNTVDEEDNFTTTKPNISEENPETKTTPRKLKPSRVPEEATEESTTDSPPETTKSSSIFDFLDDLPFMSSAFSVHSSLMNQILLTLPICVAFLLK